MAWHGVAWKCCRVGNRAAHGQQANCSMCPHSACTMQSGTERKRSAWQACSTTHEPAVQQFGCGTAPCHAERHLPCSTWSSPQTPDKITQLPDLRDLSVDGFSKACSSRRPNVLNSKRDRSADHICATCHHAQASAETKRQIGHSCCWRA